MAWSTHQHTYIPMFWSGHLSQVKCSRVIYINLKVSSTVCDSSQHLRGAGCSPSRGCTLAFAVVGEDWDINCLAGLRAFSKLMQRGRQWRSPCPAVPWRQEAGGTPEPPAELGLVLGPVAVTTGPFRSPLLMSLLCFFITLDVTQQHKCENSGKTKQMLFDKK